MNTDERGWDGIWVYLRSSVVIGYWLGWDFVTADISG
jgi:hypothetical protein